MDRSMLNKATSADDIPTPGFMFSEIAKATADINACQQLADYLLKKLERDNPHVKVKVLRIIRHVCEQGKPDFRRTVQKKSDVVKSCLQYRGTPDPLKGDAPNRAVREEADVAIKALYSSDSSTNAYGFSMEPAKKMTGFGSDNASSNDMAGRIGGIGSDGNNSFQSSGGYGGQKSYGSGGMVGFGNPNFDNAPREEKDTMLKQAASSAFSFATKISHKVQGISGSGGGGSHMSSIPDGPSSSYRAPPISADAGFGTGMQGRWGPDGSSGSSNKPPPPPPSSANGGEYEVRVVNELCMVGGARAAPPPQVLEDFCRKCASLDAKCVADQLRQKLEQHDWQVRLKALYGIEALSQHGMDGICGHICQFSSELLFECQQMPQCRQKANKVLQLLGFIDQVEEAPAPRGSVEAPAAAAAAASPPAASVDLLSMDDDPAPAATSAPAPAAPSASQDLMGGAVDFMSEAQPAAAAPTPAVANGHFSGAPAASPSGLLDFASTATPAPAPAPQGNEGGLFGNLSMKGPSAAPPAQNSEGPSLLASVEAAAAAQSQANGSSSLLASLQSGAAAAGAAPTPAFGAGLMPPQGGAAPAAAAAGGLEGNRTAHLNILSGGQPPMGGGAMPGMGAAPMQGNPMMPGLGAPPPSPAFGMMGHPGMPQQGYMGGQMPPGGMVGGMPGMMPPQMAPGAMGMQQPYAPGCGMVAPGMPQAGMFGGAAASPFPGAGGCMSAPAAAAAGSAFGFIGGGGCGGGCGGCGGCAGAQVGGGCTAAMPASGASPFPPVGDGRPAANDLAFSFVADEMKGARS